MRGITNAPQGSGGGSSGGEWTQLSPSTWGDVFETQNGKMVAKKDTWLYFIIPAVGSGWDGVAQGYFPKGAGKESFLRIPFHMFGVDTTNKKLHIGTEVEIKSTDLGATSVKAFYNTYSGTPGTDLSVTLGTAITVYLSSCAIFTKE